jgi:hypothetical protein
MMMIIGALAKNLAMIGIFILAMVGGGIIVSSKLGTSQSAGILTWVTNHPRM